MKARVFPVVAVLFSVLALSACSGGTANPTVTVIKTITAPAPTADNATPPAAVEDVDRQINEAKKYLKSSDRLQVFKNNFTPAALRIAKALESGELGPTYKYNGFKLPLKGEVGWGGIATVKGREPSAYAWVWYDKQGRIDYARGIQGTAIDAGKSNTNVQIEVDGLDGPYEVFLEKADGTHTTSVLHIGEAPVENKEHFVQPTSVSELIQLDREGIMRLNANVSKVLGSD